MTLSEYQRKARETAIYPPVYNINYSENNMVGDVSDSMPFIYSAMGLAGEAGEICNKLKKIIRDKNGKVSEETKKDISKELGDVLWYISNLAKDMDLDLNKIAQENIDKLFSRKERGVIGGSGDNR